MMIARMFAGNSANQMRTVLLVPLDGGGGGGDVDTNEHFLVHIRRHGWQ